jgi:hypothetical protein
LSATAPTTSVVDGATSVPLRGVLVCDEIGSLRGKSEGGNGDGAAAGTGPSAGASGGAGVAVGIIGAMMTRGVESVPERAPGGSGAEVLLPVLLLLLLPNQLLIFDKIGRLVGSDVLRPDAAGFCPSSIGTTWPPR